MDIEHVDEEWGHGKEDKNTPFSHKALGDVSPFVCDVWGKGQPSHDNFLWCFHLLEFLLGVLIVFYLFLLCVKKNHHDCFVPKYLIMFLSFQGLSLVVVLINSFLFFQTSVEIYC